MLTRASVSTSPSEPVAYRPIGTIAGAGGEAQRPELIRSVEARLMLEPRFAPVIGLDALDGSPILDVKPYRPVFDAAPVAPQEGGA